jgi:uroporphyrinogen-III synthase
MRILVTRADDVAGATAQRLRAQGHCVLTVPLTRIVATNAAVTSGPFAGVIATSARSLRLVSDDALLELTRLPLFAIGLQTAHMGRTRGFADVAAADGNSKSLVSLIAARMQGQLPLLYLAGQDRKPELEAILRERGYSIVVATVYQALEVDALSLDQITCLTGSRIDVVLHYSRRSTEIYLRLMKSAGLEDKMVASKHFCISAETAIPLEAVTGLQIRLAESATEASLLQYL